MIAPKRRKVRFGDSTEEELKDVALAMQKVINILDGRLGEEFPFNFYIYPLYDWYVRIVPRLKVLGGFEIATHVGVVTTDMRETMEHLREHWDE